jgi:hypothetical protein
MGTLLKLPSQGCVQVQVPVETISWGPGLQFFLKYTGIQPQYLKPASQGAKYQEKLVITHTARTKSKQISANTD